MFKRTLSALCLTAALFIGICSLQGAVASANLDDKSEVSTTADNDSGQQQQQGGKKGGNSFARALKAPFKAIGRLFGGGKKDANKIHRLTEKDVKRFESASVHRVTDALNPPAPVTPPDAAPERVVSEGKALYARGRTSEAIALLSRAVSMKPGLGEAHHLLALAYARKGLRELSVMSFNHAIRITPNDAWTLNDYGYTLYLNGQYDDALKHLKRASRSAPESARIWNNLALVQSRLGKFGDAHKSFARAGGELQGHLNIANVLKRAGRDENAIKHYQAALKFQPASPVILQNLVELYQITGRTADAEVARLALSDTKKAKVLAANGN